MGSTGPEGRRTCWGVRCGARPYAVGAWTQTSQKERKKKEAPLSMLAPVMSCVMYGVFFDFFKNILIFQENVVRDSLSTSWMF